MKLILTVIFVYINTFALTLQLDSFEADFTQTITDEKEKVLTYKGQILALQPQNAVWKYTNPIVKNVYINKHEATIVEPEIEQVIIRKIHNEFDFFKLIKNAKKISQNNYMTVYNNIKYNINIDNGVVKTISYLDQFENKVKIKFSNQKQNHKIQMKSFIPSYPVDFDIIRD